MKWENISSLSAQRIDTLIMYVREIDSRHKGPTLKIVMLLLRHNQNLYIRILHNLTPECYFAQLSAWIGRSKPREVPAYNV